MESEDYLEIFDEIIKKKMKIAMKQGGKDQNDKITCPICDGGKFIRQKKSIHEKTNRHKDAIYALRKNAKKIIKLF